MRWARGTYAGTVTGWLLGAACTAYLLAQPPTLNSADESFILYGAKRVWQGQAVYRDFFEFITPGSYYLYALAYGVGGVSITTARVATALINALSAVATYCLVLSVASMAEAILAALLVVIICVPVWAMASHHWIATAFGLAGAAVLLAPHWQRSTRTRPAAAGALGGLLVCTHQARGIWFVAWLIVAVPLLVLAKPDGRSWRGIVRELAWTALGGAAVCIPVLGYAVWRSSFGEMLQATHTWVMTSYRDYHVGKYPWASHGAFWGAGLKYTSLRLMQATPWLLGVEAVAVAWALWRTGLRPQVCRLLVLLLAISSVGAILYFPDIVHVAFILPSVLVVLAGMVFRIRSWLLRGDAPAMRAIRYAVWVLALAGMVGKAWINTRTAWQEVPVQFETAFGTLAGASLQAETIRDLAAKVPRADGVTPRVFSYPTDAWIYLALPADNPTRFALLRPGYNTPQQLQEAMDYLDHDPAAMVIVNGFAVKHDDPFFAQLKTHWYEIAGIGPPVFLGLPLYTLYGNLRPR